VEGRGGWEKEEKEGEAHGRRACGRRLGHTDLQRRRAHGFAEEGFAEWFSPKSDSFLSCQLLSLSFSELCSNFTSLILSQAY
jgi:hypothetical protein